MPGYGLKQQGAVLDGAPERADLVQRRCVGNEPVAGDKSVGGFQPDHTAEGGGLADRAAGVGTEGGGSLAGGEGGGAASRRAAGDAFQIVGICGEAGGGVFRRRAHGEFVHVEPAPKHDAGGAQAGGDGGVVGRDEVGQHLGGRGEGLILDRDDVLESDRYAIEGAEGLAAGAPCIGVGGLAQGVLSVVGVKGLDSVFDSLSPQDDGLGQFDGGQAAGGERGGKFSDGLVV